MSSQNRTTLAPVAVLKITPLHGGVPQQVGPDITLTDGQSLRIGRARTNDLVLADTKVSRFHAIISGSSAGVVISDLASTNGTFVNGKRMQAPLDLSNGDEMDLGGYRLTVELATHAPVENVSDSSKTTFQQMLPFEVSVLLVDVCGYTTMVQALPEEDVAEMLRSWLEFSASIITKYNGSVDKFIGDCVMSLWRSDSMTPKDLAMEAALAGIYIVKSTNDESLFTGWKHSDKFPWRCRAVLHSGTALLGNMGGRGNYTVLGDTVNIAFRLEQLADRFEEKFIVSDHTAELLGEEIPLTSLGTFSLEGRSGTIDVFGRTIP